LSCPRIYCFANPKPRAGTECSPSFHSFVHIPINHSLLGFNPKRLTMQCFYFFPVCRILLRKASYVFIWSMKLSLSSWNFSETTSHRSIRSSKPFSSASTAVVPSTVLSALPSATLYCPSLTVCLYSDVHKLLRRMGD